MTESSLTLIEADTNTDKAIAMQVRAVKLGFPPQLPKDFTIINIGKDKEEFSSELRIASTGKVDPINIYSESPNQSQQNSADLITVMGNTFQEAYGSEPKQAVNALKNMASRLKPGGYLVTQNPMSFVDKPEALGQAGLGIEFYLNIPENEYDPTSPSHPIAILRKPQSEQLGLSTQESQDYKTQVLAADQKLEKTLKEMDPNFTPTLEDLEETRQLLLYLESNIDHVLSPIHDLWAVSRFKNGYSYADTKNTNKENGPLTHPLLVSLSKMQNVTIERYLAQGDMRGLVMSLSSRLGQNQQEQPVSRNWEAKDKSRIINTIGYLSRNSQFLAEAAPSIHSTWSKMEAMKEKINTQYNKDPRALREFSELTAEEQELTLGNIKSDLLSVLIFLQSK